MAIGNTALTLNIQFRIEELRLYLWGRNWDLVKEIEGMDVKAQAKADSDEAAREASDSETVDSSK
jgi:ribosomal protein L5